MTPAERIGANLKVLRRAAGLNQEELAWRVGVHRSQISLWEKGTQPPRVLTVIKLAAGCGATPNDLLEAIVWTLPEYSPGGFRIGADA